MATSFWAVLTAVDCAYEHEDPMFGMGQPLEATRAYHGRASDHASGCDRGHDCVNDHGRVNGHDHANDHDHDHGSDAVVPRHTRLLV